MSIEMSNAPIHSELVFAVDAAELLARRTKELRLAEGWKRETLATRAGVTVASLKRFERSGKASLELVLKVAGALGRLEDFAKVLEPAEFRTMAELEQHAQAARRKRGSR